MIFAANFSTPTARILRTVFAMFVALSGAIVLLVMSAVNSAAAPLDRRQVETFLDVTGFDVAVETIVHSADFAPRMIGIDPNKLGSQWQNTIRAVFDKEKMREAVVTTLQDRLDPEAVEYAQAFYSSEIGQRLVRAENASHDVQDGVVTREAGTRIVSQMVRDGDPKLEIFLKMSRAIDVDDLSVTSIHDLQVRFMLAAQAAGILEITVDEDTLRAALKESEPQLRRSIQEGNLASNAYTYQGFSEDDLLIYSDALAHPLMQQLYRQLNHVQYALQAELFEVLAYRLADLVVGEDL